MPVEVATQEEPTPTGGQAPAIAAAWAVRADDLSLDLPTAGPRTGARPILRGLTVRVTDEGLREGLTYATTVVDRLSRTKIDEFLDQLAASPWLRSFRWYYASLLRLAAIENGLDLDGELTGGRIVAHARFRSAADRGFLGQLRDLAKGAVTVTARIAPSVGDRGRLRLRLELDPDVRGSIARLILGAAAKRPGIYRVDDATVEIDVGILFAQAANVPLDWDAAVRSVEVAPAMLTVVFGPRERGEV
jgi:hypothetical protein